MDAEAILRPCNGLIAAPLAGCCSSSARRKLALELDVQLAQYSPEVLDGV